MFKRISCLTLSIVLCLGILFPQASALGDPGVYVDGKAVEAACAVIYEGTAYVSLRSVTQAMRPDAAVSWAGDHAVVTASGLSLTAYPGACYLQVNGRYLYLPYGVRMSGGVVLVPARVLTQALGGQVWWDSDGGNVCITSGTGAIASGDSYYNSNDLYWLSHIIYAESGNQPLNGKIGVGNVILNRVKSPLFPNSIQGVLFQASQFTTVSNGTIYKEPNAESVLAAKLCLDGAVVLPTALWFNAAGVSCWASRNRAYVTTIGGHAFYS